MSNYKPFKKEMKIEEANKVLEELYEVGPEKLNDKAKRLFEAMMKIADERDSVKADLYEANNRINDLLDIAKQKDKEIEELNKSDESKEQSSMKYYNLYKELVDKIKAKIEEVKDGTFDAKIVLQSLLEKE